MTMNTAATGNGNGNGKGRGNRRMVWIAAGVIALALVGAALWYLAINARSVETLDRIDRFYTGGNAELVDGPVQFGEHPQQRLFVHRAPDTASDAGLPVIVFIHGGSWRSGDPEPYAYVARNFAPAGYVVVSAGYRLGEAGRFPGMLQDGAAALRWVRDNIATHGGNPDRIAVMGHSAGAYNAKMLALDTQWLAAEGLGPDTIDAVIGIAGPYDFLPLDSDSTKAAFGHVEPLESTQPIHHARPDAPPTLLITGDADETVRPRNVPAMAQALTDAGMPESRVRTVTIPGMGHIPIVMALSTPFEKDGRVKAEIRKFLAENLAPERPEIARISVTGSGLSSADVQAENE